MNTANSNDAVAQRVELPIHMIVMEVHVDAANGLGMGTLGNLMEQQLRNAASLGAAILANNQCSAVKTEKLEEGKAVIRQTVRVLKIGVEEKMMAATQAAYKAGVEAVLADLERAASSLSDAGNARQAKAYMDLADELRDRRVDDKHSVEVELVQD
jgi:hypothetical protein